MAYVAIALNRPLRSAVYPKARRSKMGGYPHQGQPRNPSLYSHVETLTDGRDHDDMPIQPLPHHRQHRLDDVHVGEEVGLELVPYECQRAWGLG